MGLTYGVYTGPTEQEERLRLQHSPPDVLLTNYSMLEDVLTRGDGRRLFRHSSLRYLVLDEVHTYQGAPSRRLTGGRPGDRIPGRSARSAARDLRFATTPLPHGWGVANDQLNPPNT
jgi:hypothetical protein